MDLLTLKAQLALACETARQQPSREANAEVRRLRRTMSEAITDGAGPCRKCRRRPHGMEQPTARGVEYEIGCLACPNTRVRAKTLRGAHLLWNGEEYV